MKVLSLKIINMAILWFSVSKDKLTERFLNLLSDSITVSLLYHSPKSTKTVEILQEEASLFLCNHEVVLSFQLPVCMKDWKQISSLCIFSNLLCFT